MLRSVKGVYKDGKIELLEQPADERPTQVIVTFLAPDGAVELPQGGIDEQQAADLRARLRTFAEDWDRPEMDVYDDL